MILRSSSPHSCEITVGNEALVVTLWNLTRTKLIRAPCDHCHKQRDSLVSSLHRHRRKAKRRADDPRKMAVDELMFVFKSIATDYSINNEDSRRQTRLNIAVACFGLMVLMVFLSCFYLDFTLAMLVIAIWMFC